MNIASINFADLQQKALPDFKFSFSDGIGGIVSAAIPYIFSLAGIILLLMLLSGGFKLMTSRGDPKAVQSGKGIITNALLGFVIIFVSYWIVQLVGLILDIDVIGNIF